jgi:hypothetical protein
LPILEINVDYSYCLLYLKVVINWRILCILKEGKRTVAASPTRFEAVSAGDDVMIRLPPFPREREPAE